MIDHILKFTWQVKIDIYFLRILLVGDIFYGLVKKLNIDFKTSVTKLLTEPTMKIYH